MLILSSCVINHPRVHVYATQPEDSPSIDDELSFFLSLFCPLFCVLCQPKSFSFLLLPTELRQRCNLLGFVVAAMTQNKSNNNIMNITKATGYRDLPQNLQPGIEKCFCVICNLMCVCVLQVFYLCLATRWAVNSSCFFTILMLCFLLLLLLKLPRQQQQTIPHGQWANALTKVLGAVGKRERGDI